MTFNIVAMICVAGMSYSDCSPLPGYSRDVATIGEASNEIACGVQAQQSLGRIAIFHDLAPGEFIKIMCARKG
jgi:hypothetical protein